MSDLISRRDAIDVVSGIDRAFVQYIEALPSAEPDRGEWTTEEVAEILARVLGDECACNFNGIDEWLPSSCKYADTECPTPKEKHGCWMQFLMQGGADMEGAGDEQIHRI